MRIALVKAPWWVRYCPPCILASLGSILREQGHSVRLHDLNNSLYHLVPDKYKKYWDDRDFYSFWENPSFVRKLFREIGIDRALEEILREDPQVIGFTTHTPSVIMSLALAERIKKIDKKRIIVFLGHKCSRAQMAFDFIGKPFIDYVCTGEADLALPELLAKLDNGNGGSLPESAGFLSRREGKTIDSGNPPVVENLDDLPFPDYSDFSAEIASGRYSQPNRLDILDSRGCINACHFCYERLYWQKYRSLSGKRIFEEIKYLSKQFPRINYFYFNGLLLNGALENLEDFCDLAIKDNLPVNWAGQAMIRPDMTKELLLKMKRAGCRWLGYGIESGSGELLERMNKRYRISDAERVLRDTHEAGISVQVNFMFGFPTETAADFKKTLSLLDKIRPYIDNILASQSFFTLEKETFVREHPEQFGISHSSHHLYWKSDDGKNDYGERLRRYEEFCRRAISLGVPETSGVLAKKPDKWFLLGNFHLYEKNYEKACVCYRKSLKEEGESRETYTALAEACEKLKKTGHAAAALKHALKIKTFVEDEGENERLREKLSRLKGKK
ncbi:MAG TPA: radical SAM protein [bacterium]|nr:radical SAM protein [bacterium]